MTSSLIEPLPSTMVTRVLKVPVGIFVGPLAILKSRFSKSRIGCPSKDAGVMKSSNFQQPELFQVIAKRLWDTAKNERLRF